jgi:hypothetical protein
MEIKKEGQTFFKGMHKDFSPAFQPEDTYRDATNIELTSAGEQMIINQIKSCVNLKSKELNTAYTIESVNILGYTIAKASISGVPRDGFVVYAHVKADSIPSFNNGIYFFAQDGTYADGTIYTICSGSDLNFSPTTSIDSFFTEDRENKTVYFTDFSNTLRKIQMDTNVWPYASASDLNVISDASSAMSMTITGLGNAGSLLAGTYQLAYRLKQTATSPSTYTKWSTFTNPVAIIPLSYTSGTTVNYYGGKVGEATSRSIEYQITLSSGETADYNELEIAVVKNNDGTYAQQLVAYVNTVQHSLSTGSSGIVSGTYKGTEAEYELDIDEITAPDAPIETVKTIVEKDNRLLAGNIKYFDRRIADGEVNIIEAKTIRRTVDYEDPLNTTRYRGYFRDEVYRFGITYHDEYGNWSPVKPLNFSGFSANGNKQGAISQFGTITSGGVSGVNYNSNTITVSATSTFTTGASGFVAGESVYCVFTFPGIVSLQFITEVQSVSTGEVSVLIPGATFAPYASLTGATGTAILQPVNGNAYNHSSDQFSWKFPKREHIGVANTGATGTFGTLEYGTYSLLASTGGSSLPQALGLGLQVSGHPDWAKGMAVVRMDRDRDILYQTPLVPASLYLGVSTPGKTVTGSNVDYTTTDGVGELDYLGPKCLKMGAARNMQILTPNAASGGAIGGPAITPQQTIHLPTYQGLNSFERMLWKKAFAPAVDYVYNALGSGLIGVPDLVTMDVDIVDVCGFKLSSLTPITPTITYNFEDYNNRASTSTPTGYVEARVYSCLSHTQHWYPNNYVNMRTYTSGGVAGGIVGFVNTYRRKIQESFLQVNGVQTASFVGSQMASDVNTQFAATGSIAPGFYVRTLFNLNSLSTTKLLIPATFGQSRILLDSPEQASQQPLSVSRYAVNYLIGGTELVGQQKGNGIIDMTDSGTAALYTTNVQNQRSLIISLNQPLEDPLYPIVANYCPLSVGQFGYIPRDTTNTGRTDTFANVAFAQYLDNFNFSSTGKQLRNGLIYNNPFMNTTWNGSYAYNSVDTSGRWNNQVYMPSYPRQEITTGTTGSSYLFAPIENVDGGVEFRFTGTTGNVSGSYNQYSNPSDDLQQALYVANLRAGKSDGRYGNPNQIQEYIHTGAYQKINSTGQTVALEVWGGDCFISKYRYKVNDEYNVPGYYLPTESATGGFDFNIKGCCESLGQRGPSRVFKTGTKVSPEYIEMYTEGEANAFYNSDKDRFPYYNRTAPNAGSVGDYQADAFYNYNFGYSIENFPKKFFSENRLTSVSQNYPARLIYSDVRSADLNQDGFSRFRALNFFDMDEKYGKVTKIALLNDGEPIIGQDDSISLLYVNKSLTTLQDNSTLAVQGGTYISDNTPPKYLTTNYGVELLRCMIPTENGVYALDTKRGVLINLLDGAKIVSLSRMEQYFRENFSETYVPWLEHTIQMSYDRVDKVLYIMGALSNADNPNDNENTFAWLSYGVKIDAFMSNLDWEVSGHGGKLGNRPLYIFDLNGSTYMLQTHRNNLNNIADIHINQWKGATNDYLKLLSGTHINRVDANIEYVFNKSLNEPKVLDVVGINSQSTFSQYNITSFNDGTTANPLLSLSTGDQASTGSTRLGMNSTNFIRGTGDKRLVGAYHIIKLWFNNQSSAIKLRSAINQFRKVFR